MSPDLTHVESWVFDLDNTLYSAECKLFAQIDARMTAFIRDRLAMGHWEARRLQKAYYVEYGTTMSGLMEKHDVCPDEFLEYVHDIDVSAIKENHSLSGALAALPGRKFIFTNGSVRHAENVAGALGIVHHFDEIFDIKAAGYAPKPKREPYEKFLSSHGIDPSGAVMFEDIVQNLEAPHALGMTTVLVHSDAAWLEDEPHEKRPARKGDIAPHVHYVTDDIAAFLKTATITTENAG
ncbi:MAG: pyrimidine 5'-nucleotidase [Parvularcula sp.]|uniref:pyrimidine 5'-nucleotidase n=1 Tax=Hyphococcus sp. TaxID=2038636 RepID=UPI000C4E6977|nr:pyrimidine 5'-nucleotidase [Parvularcula sp.]